MSYSPVKIKIKINSAEIEIESDVTNLSESINYIPKLIQFIPENSNNNVYNDESSKPKSQSIPYVQINKSESLSVILLKIFQNEWGEKPKKLNEIREILNSYGLAYPKQTVAVTLLRMVQSGKLRRFKDNSNEYVYTPSNSLFKIENSINNSSTSNDELIEELK